MRKYDIDKRKSVFIGMTFILIGFAMRSLSSSLSNSPLTIVGGITLSIGIGFILASIFANEAVLKKDIKKYTMLPLLIMLVALSFDKFHMNIPILQGLLMCTINICFFRKEIKKSLKL